MYEITRSKTKHGVFDLYLDKKAPSWAFLTNLGPYIGRLIGMSLLGAVLYFSLSQVPAEYFLSKSWAADQSAALALQKKIGNILLAVAIFIYLQVFLFRKEQLELSFDRPEKKLSLHHTPFFRFSQARNYMVPFAELGKIEKLPPQPGSKWRHGSCRVSSEKLPPKLKDLEFALMSDEQYEFYPQNLAQITGLDLQGPSA